MKSKQLVKADILIKNSDTILKNRYNQLLESVKNRIIEDIDYANKNNQTSCSTYAIFDINGYKDSKKILKIIRIYLFNLNYRYVSGDYRYVSGDLVGHIYWNKSDIKLIKIIKKLKSNKWTSWIGSILLYYCWHPNNTLMLMFIMIFVIIIFGLI